MKAAKQMGRVEKRKAFTLIELLVVIAIIAILAAILFPVFARARENARKSSCLSNMKQIGIGLQQYTQDFDENMPMSYYYGQPASGPVCPGTDSDGILHWSGYVQPYLKSEQVFVCPSDKNKGLAPTNFQAPNTGAPGQTSLTTTKQDYQATRISYTANEAVMPRPRGGICKTNGYPQAVVKLSAIDETSKVIALAEFTDYPNAVGGGGSSGAAYKSHRPTDAWVLDAAGTSPYDSDSGTTAPATVYAISSSAAKTLFAAQETVSYSDNSKPHFIYMHADRHLGGNNYLFMDGHAKWLKVERTLDCNNFMWGKRTYNQTTPSDVQCSDGSGAVK